MRDNRDLTKKFKKTGEDTRENESTTKVINHLTTTTNGTNNNHSAILPPNGSRSGANNKHRGDHYRR